VLVLVGLGGRLDGRPLHRTAALELGEGALPSLAGRVRTDQHGQSYFEVPMRSSDGPR
jgi:hypothetical protein